jgi:hydrogenase-4 component F
MILALVLLPMLAGVAAFFVRGDRMRRSLLVATAGIHALMTSAAWVVRPAPQLGGWVSLDPPEILFLSITSALFLTASIYAVGYLAREGREKRTDLEEGLLFSNAPEATFTGCLLLFLASMTLVAVAQHFGLLWVAVEATTLASAPLIHFHRHHRSLEAAWKYLVICSVGIAIALLGNFFLVVATTPLGERLPSMTVHELVTHANRLDPGWLKAAFLLLLVGYGTKMGLAPLHTWLPDAHSEAPSVISALLSGAVLNCAFLAILRVHAVCAAAGLAPFSQSLFVIFGLVSMGFGAVFIVGQLDFKRMLAYSSVEHMGIAALGVGVGGVASFGALLHVVNHSLAKAMLFLLAGNVIALYRTKSASQVTGVLRALPVTGALWLAGFFAITGSPPFGLFVSELTILQGCLDAGRYVVAAVYLALLLTVFVGMTLIILRMAHGLPVKLAERPGRVREPLLAILPPAVLGLGVLALGLHIPGPLRSAIDDAIRLLRMF